MPPAGPKATTPAYVPEETTAAPTNYVPGSTYVPPTYEAPPPQPVYVEPYPVGPTNYVPGSTYVPDYGQEPLYYAEPPVPSETYGGASGVPPTWWNDPSVVVTTYPSTGAEPTAQYTPHKWEQAGRTAPANYDKVFPASAMKPPEVEPFVPSPDRYMPGPPRNYVPGSSYVPLNPLPDPRVPFDERIAPPVNARMVPGSQVYRTEAGTPYITPGLGGVHAGPLSPEGRPFAPTDPNTWMVTDPREPQLPQPGSTYVPRYVALPPLGDPKRTWQPIVPSERYGAGLPESERAPEARRVDTIYPATGATETRRSTGYVGSENARVIANADAINRERTYTGEGQMGSANPNPTITNREQILMAMEMERRRRHPGAHNLPGLFGSPPVAWDRPMSQPVPPGDPWEGSIFMPGAPPQTAPLNDPSAARTALRRDR